MRSMAGGGAFHRAYYHATQQAFLEAHELAFGRLQRVKNEEWSALADDFRTLVATQDLVDLPPIQVPHCAESSQPGF
jgi:hypothetical protein